MKHRQQFRHKPLLLSQQASLLTAVVSLLFASLSVSSCKKDDNYRHFPPQVNSINHLVVIYLENHSFDNLYGGFRGANGLANATPANTRQVDSAGTPYQFLPPVPGATNFPTNLPNRFFNINQYVSNDLLTPDVLHRFYQEQLQIDGGRMDKYALYNYISGGLSLGYYQTNLLPLARLAKEYTLCDNMFHSAFGGSFLNHQWLIASASPTFANAPASMVAQFDRTGRMIKDGTVTPDGYVVNTTYPVNTPHPASADPSTLIPAQTTATIGDRLSDKNISWAWFSGGWDSAVAGHPAATFQFHHQPFVYYARYADGTEGRKNHLKDETQFIAAAKNGTLPSVSFVKPLGIDNEHPGYSNVEDGENHTVDLINDVLNGPNGKDAAIIITYDENGGFWDHVAPPLIDLKWGPGTRVPGIIISPFAKRGFVDHTQYETVSILSFIEKRWNVSPLTARDKNANPFRNAFDFSQTLAIKP